MANSVHPGSYSLLSLKLVVGLNSTSPVAYDVRSTFLTMNIYENLYSNTLSGNVTLIDSNNMIDNVPIKGNEHINIKFKTSFTDDVIDLTFKIYKIDNVVNHAQKAKTYNLQFISEEAITNYNYRISKKYVGTKELIVKDIISKISKKSVFTDSLLTSYTMFFPNWNPFKCINYMLNFISIDSNTSDYMFWESLYGFKLKSLSLMLKEKSKHNINSNITIARSQKSGGEKQKYNQSNYETITDLAIPNIIDDLGNIMQGSYGATTYISDILNKTSNKYQYTYDDSDSSNNMINIHNDNNYNYNLIMKRNSIINLMKSNTIFTSVPGITERTVGDMMNVNIISNEVENRLDSTLSGKYICTGICHNFTPQIYTQNLSLFK